jgi:hypothetical protein
MTAAIVVYERDLSHPQMKLDLARQEAETAAQAVVETYRSLESLVKQHQMLRSQFMETAKEFSAEFQVVREYFAHKPVNELFLGKYRTGNEWSRGELGITYRHFCNCTPKLPAAQPLLPEIVDDNANENSSPLVCPLCEMVLPTHKQLKQHGKSIHDIKGTAMEDFISAQRRIEDAKNQAVAKEKYQRILVEQTPHVLGKAYQQTGLLLPFHGDGTEHKFIRLLDSAIECVGRQEPLTYNEHRTAELLLFEFRAAAVQFRAYADKLQTTLESPGKYSRQNPPPETELLPFGEAA